MSELFPVELRGLAIALFYVADLLAGRPRSPWLLGALIESGERVQVLWGYLLGAGPLCTASLASLWLGVPAEPRSLEAIAALDGGSP